mmetsp:Transcript_4223/g.7711  ORF Transcript_4223/g.7711 Transcript_4223/m.7711 type:complete len:304 (+) Transcript_4223:3-914(+)
MEKNPQFEYPKFVNDGPKSTNNVQASCARFAIAQMLEWNRVGGLYELDVTGGKKNDFATKSRKYIKSIKVFRENFGKGQDSLASRAIDVPSKCVGDKAWDDNNRPDLLLGNCRYFQLCVRLLVSQLCPATDKIAAAAEKKIGSFLPLASESVRRESFASGETSRKNQNDMANNSIGGRPVLGSNSQLSNSKSGMMPESSINDQVSKSSSGVAIIPESKNQVSSSSKSAILPGESSSNQLPNSNSVEPRGLSRQGTVINHVNDMPNSIDRRGTVINRMPSQDQPDVSHYGNRNPTVDDLAEVHH